jgi:hypothetical protein
MWEKPTHSARMVALPLGLRPLTQVNKSRTRGQHTHERLTGHAGSWSERFHKYPSAPHAESYIIGLCYWYRDAPIWLPNHGIENNILTRDGRRDCNYWLDKDASNWHHNTLNFSWGSFQCLEQGASFNSTRKKSSSTRETSIWLSASIILISLLFALEF